jgi:acyl phosphate:glycerol-3-phosphate acyltransferase
MTEPGDWSHLLPWLLVPAAYLLGSVSFAWIAGRIKGVDLRQHGSGNLGATNAGRVLGGQWFALVFSADVAKGVLPVVLAHLLPITDTLRPWLLVAVAAAAVIGHIFTCFHGFKGGKAVATSLGVLIGLVPLLAAMSFGIWLVLWLLGWLAARLGKAGAVGPASMLTAVATPALRIGLHPSPFAGGEALITGFLIVLALAVLVKHRSNFLALLKRTPHG